MLTLSVIAVLMTIVFLAFATETVVGFGSTVLIVTLGAHLMPLNELLPSIIPLNIGLSLWIVLRYHHQINREYIVRKVLPAVGVGLIGGLALYRVGSPAELLLFFCCLVALMSVYELYKEWKRIPVASQVSSWQSFALLGAGGFVHGMFGSGGPLIVYVASRQLREKGTFRATLAALWLALNVLLMANFQLAGDLTKTTMTISILLLPMVMLGIFVGDRAHRILPERVFRVIVWAVLLFASAMLIGRYLLS